MKDEIKFDEDTGAPIRRVTIHLKGRSDEEIDADIEELFGEGTLRSQSNKVSKPL